MDINSLDYLYCCTKCNIEKPNSEFPKRTKKDRKRIRYFFTICKKCNNIRLKQYRRTSEVSKKYKLKYFFNLEYDKYLEMLEKQNNCCAICNVNQDTLKKKLSVDHNHITGKVRGLLCEQCNFGIGNLKDSLELLKQAIKYLEENDDKQRINSNC